jgi:hypothetical protein
MRRTVKSDEVKYKNVARVCGFAIAIAYFLPWVDYVMFRYSGMELYKVFDAMEKIQSFTTNFANSFSESLGEKPVEQEKIKRPLWLYGTMLLPVIGVVSAIINKKLLHIFSAVLTLAILTWAIIGMNSLWGKIGGESEETPSIIQIISIGLWTTIIAPLGQIFGAFKCDVTSQESPV